MRAVLVAAALPMTIGGPAGAAGGDVFAAGTQWCASTYPGHGTLSGFGPPLDMGSPSDYQWPIYAPGDGTVEIHTEGYGGGWGNSIIWTRADGGEKIHMAHLDSFGKTGKVVAGDLIGRVGQTGQATAPHLHASAQVDGKPWPLHLQGKEIEAGSCYTSPGPIPPLCQGEQATLIGTSGDDVLVGTGGRDVILGKGGDDTIDGRGGDDVICGGGGSDVLIGKGGADRLQGGPEGDTLRGGAGADVLTGAKGADVLKGGPDPDELIGGSGADRLLGGKKADTLVPGPGADVVRGGRGQDLVSYTGSVRAVSADLEVGTATGQGADDLAAVERVRGSPFGDQLSGDDAANVLYGEAGDDVLDGRGGEDVVDGGPGSDVCLGEVLAACEA